MISALSRSGWRGLLTHPGQLVLAVVGVMAGVAVVVGVDLTRVSAMRAMTLSNEAVLGRATHRISSPQNNLDEKSYFRARDLLRGEGAVAAVVEGWVQAAPGAPAVRALGVDPLSEARFERVAIAQEQWVNGRTFVDLIARPGAFFTTRQTAASYGWSMNAAVEVRINGQNRELLLAGWLDDAPGSHDLLLMDIASAQELFESFGHISFVDIRLLEPADAPRLLAPLRREGYTVRPAGSQLSHTLKMTRSFYTNLTALSLLAALVGAFLVFNTMSFLVVQRRREIGVLRALGVTPAEVFRRTQWEALLIGSVASVLGLVAGVALAHGLVNLVTQTINDLYYAVSVRQLNVTTLQLAKALLLGVGCSLLAAAVPAYRASRLPPRLTMRASEPEATGLSAASLSTASALCLGVGALLLLGPGKSVWLGFAGLFVVLGGFALITPVIMRWFLHRLSRARSLGVSARTSMACALSSSGRLALAASALMVALAAVIGIGLMILSFRGSVDSWLQQLLRADVYVAVQGPQTQQAAVDSRFVRGLRESAALRAVTTVWSTQVDGVYLGADVSWSVSVYDLTREAFSGFQFLHGDADSAWAAFINGGIIVSEPFARHHVLDRGESVKLKTAAGVRSMPIAAIYQDYGSDAGVIAMNRDTFARHWAEPGVGGIGLYLAEGKSMDDARRVLAGANHRQLALVVQDSRSIREQALTVFDRTFAVTQALRALAALVAMVGVFSALMALQTERAREFGMLRAVGFTRADLTRMSLVQCLVVGLVAGLVAVPAGLAICVGLIDGINLRSFGWSVNLLWTWETFASGVLLCLVSALAAGLIPALKLSRTPIQQLRQR